MGKFTQIESPSPRSFFAGRGRHAAKRSAGEGRCLKPQFAQALAPSSAFGTFSPAEKREGEGLSMSVIRYRRRSH
jgi:hypothetical protein